MSVLDPSSLLQLNAPELLAPPDPPVTPAIDNSTASTADSTSSGSSSDSATLGSMTAQESADAGLLGANVTTGVNVYETAAEDAAAALIDLGGASRVIVDDYESSVPPNLAAASALLSELTANSNGNSGVLSAAYLALNSDDALSLTVA